MKLFYLCIKLSRHVKKTDLKYKPGTFYHVHDVKGGRDVDTT